MCSSDDVRFAGMTDSGKPATEADVSGDGPLVVLENVNKYFGELHVLKDIDLTIHRGEVVVVIGAHVAPLSVDAS